MQNTTRISLIALGVSVLTFWSAASIAADILNPEQLLARYGLSDLNASPTGQQIALTVAEPVSGDTTKSSIWFYDIAAEEFRRLTYAGERDTHPRWSQAGERLAFLSKRGADEAQIYVLPMNGGEGRPLTDWKSGIAAFEWSPDAKTIAFLAVDPLSAEDESRKKDKDDVYVVSEELKPVRIYLLDVASQEVRLVTPGDDLRYSNIIWLPGSEKLIVTASDVARPDLLTSRIFSVDIESGALKELSRPDGPFEDVKLSPDGRTIAFIGSSDGGPIPHDIFLLPISGGPAQNLTGQAIDRPIVDYTWQDDGSLAALAVDGFGQRFFRISIAGEIIEQRSFPDRSLSEFQIVGSRIAYLAASSTSPVELWLDDSVGASNVSHLQDDFGSLVSPQIFTYEAADEFQIEAALFLPPGQRPEALPLITLVHGGPTGRWSHRINDWAQLLVARGYAVFAPNIRGSVGYGLSFVRSNRNDWGGKDFGDVMAGIDALIERGVADQDRLAIGGWSYGGYMRAWAVTQTNRFKGAVVGAAMTDLAVEYGTETADINAYDTWFLGDPYENLEAFTRMSPMTHVRHVQTPSLILIGEEDPIDPIAQSQQFYRALQRLGVDTELVIYPRELHGIREEKHRLDLLNRMINWFEKYLN